MTTLAQPPLSPSGRPPRRVSATTMVLSLAVALFGTATIVLAALHFRLAAGVAGGAGDDAVLKQGDTVSPKTKSTGVVNYPLPYAAPPNLTLIQQKP